MTIQERITLLAQAIGTDVKQLQDSITALGGGTPFVTIEKNVSSTPAYSGEFTITGLTGLSTGSIVQIFQSKGPYTGKGSLADEAEDMCIANAYVLNATTIKVHWQVLHSPLIGNIKFTYKIL